MARGVIGVRAATSIREAARLMYERKSAPCPSWSAIVLVGILTETDVLDGFQRVLGATPTSRVEPLDVLGAAELVPGFMTEAAPAATPNRIASASVRPRASDRTMPATMLSPRPHGALHGNGRRHQTAALGRRHPEHAARPERQDQNVAAPVVDEAPGHGPAAAPPRSLPRR